jgi:hypothetical protein
MEQCAAGGTVQTVTSLPGGTNWVDYIQTATTTDINTNLLLDFNPPAGMALVPAGLFMIGDNLDNEYDAIPTNVTVGVFHGYKSREFQPMGGRLRIRRRQRLLF